MNAMYTKMTGHCALSRHPSRAAWRAPAAALAVMAVWAGAEPAWAAPTPGSLNVISGLHATKKGDKSVLRFKGSAEPIYTVFKVPNPDKLVVDVTNGDLSALKSPFDIEGHDHVSAVLLSTLKNGDVTVGRIVIPLALAVEYAAHAEGNDLIVELAVPQAGAPDAKAGETAAAPAAEAPVVAVAEPAPVAAPEAVVKAPEAAPAVAAAPAPIEEPTADTVAAQTSEVDLDSVPEPASPYTLKSVKFVKGAGDAREVKLGFAGSAPKVFASAIADPPRLVIDLPYTKRQSKADITLGDKLASKIRFGAHGKHLRLVVDGTPEVAAFTHNVKEGKSGQVIVSLAPAGGAPAPDAPKTALAQAEPTAPAPQPTPPAPTVVSPEAVVIAPEPATVAIPEAELAAAEPSPMEREIKLLDVQFTSQGGKQFVTAKFDRAPAYRLTVNEKNRKILELRNVIVPVAMKRRLDTTAYGGAVTMVATYQLSEKSRIARIALDTSRDAESRVVRDGTNLLWELTAKAPELPKNLESGGFAHGVEEGTTVFAEASPGVAAGFATGDGSFAAQGATGQSDVKKFKGRKISLDFKDADIHNILRLISDVSKLNIVISDDVKGSVTVTLRNVPWDEALDIILQSKGLGQEKRGNIIRVASIETLKKEAETKLAEKKAKIDVEPLKIRLIPVNYAIASDLRAQVTDILSERGSATVDERTNVIIVKDIVSHLSKAENLIRNLDTQTPQVLIEARIVEANAVYNYSLGIQWGGNFVRAPQYGNQTGLAFPNTVGIFGGAEDQRTVSPLTGTSSPGAFGINLPAPVGAGSGGAVGFIFGNASGSANLNLRLSALENSGSIKVVSSPKITTLDNKEATITQGVSIPISQTSAAGVNTVFVDAQLNLKVTPHVTADGSILLKILIENNQPDFGRTGAAGDPTILKETVTTEMLIKDGDTTVIGGIYVRRVSSELVGVPLLSKLPILGFLFRRDTDKDERNELLIFITPRISNRSKSFVASAN